MTGALRVLVVDDHPVVLAGLTALIDTADDLVVCGAAKSVAEVRAVAGERDARIDLALSRIRAALSEEDREALRHDAAELYDGLPRLTSG